jgi:hypothetical protein
MRIISIFCAIIRNDVIAERYGRVGEKGEPRAFQNERESDGSIDQPDVGRAKEKCFDVK